MGFHPRRGNRLRLLPIEVRMRIEREPMHAPFQQNDGRRLFLAKRTAMNTSIPIACFSLTLASLLSSPTSAAVSRSEYDALIREARAGNHEPALIMLRQHG